MGRPINNIRKAGIRIKQNKEGYKRLVALANRVGLSLTGNADFATPSPSIIALAAGSTALKNAAAFMGQKRNRASKAEKLDAQAKATDLRSLLTAELAYVLTTLEAAVLPDSPTFATKLAGSGFAMSDIRSLNPRAQIPTFVRQDNSKLHPGNEGRLNWKKPLGLIKGAKVAGYNIIIGGVIVQTTTKTNAIIPNVPGVSTNVMIQPFNSRGYGGSFYATVKGLS